MKAGVRATALRLLVLWVVAGVALELFFVLRIAAMRVVDPQSTSFQRSAAWAIAWHAADPAWRQQWIGYDRISPHLKASVIASEDAGFVDHAGVEWDALDKAWGRNRRAEANADQLRERAEAAHARAARRAAARGASLPPARSIEAKVVGGSTITQQLAKNLFLSGERALPRKAEEMVLAFALEALLDKRRILEIYLNSVEWGDGVFGAEAAAHHYFHLGAGRLDAQQAAQLAVMLPAPKRYEKRPASGYLLGRAAVVAARAGRVEVP